MIVNSISMDLKFPGEKMRKIWQEAYYLLNQKQPTAQLLSQLLGKLNATCPALQMAPLFYRSLQICLKQTLSDDQQDSQAVVKLFPLAMEDLQWWHDHAVNIHDNIIRCFSSGLGSHLQWHSDLRSMVPFGTIPPHQRPGTSSSYPSSSDLCQREI